jgi:tRNA 2-thiouridine synthesizing protein C
LVCAESMHTLGLQPNDLSIAATVATAETITQTLQAADEVLVF